MTEARWWRWQRGRQQSGYDKFCLLQLRWPLPCDAYLLRFPVGSSVPPHRDAVSAGRHYRVNLILRHARSGGEFHCDDMLWSSRRIKWFRPDQALHSVSAVTAGTRYVLSVGWIRP
ncbi:MAG: hypothetical protein Tsb002_11880 [Wenzhouxiangellaceae bacterium]